MSSAGFWPGNDAFPESSVLLVCLPGPAGFATAQIEPDGARWDPALECGIGLPGRPRPVG